MSKREDFRRIYLFSEFETMFHWNWPWGGWESTLIWQNTHDRWVLEGMPASYSGSDFLKAFDYTNFLMLPSNNGIMPGFEEKVIDEDEAYVTTQGRDGIVARRPKGKNRELSMPEFIRYPLDGTRASWNEFKKQLDPSWPRRYLSAEEKETIRRKAEDSEDPVAIAGVSFYGLFRNWMGVEAISYLVCEDPALYEEMVDTLCELTVSVWRKNYEGLGIQLDLVFCWEDMAGKNGPLLSPQTFKRYMVPAYRRVLDTAASVFNCRNATVDSDGNVELLIPLWLESGVNSIHPCEVAAGMDVVRLRKKYGHDLVLAGGIDKRILKKGKAAIDEELEYKLSIAGEGGYFPQIDHSIPPDASYENFLYYRKRMKEILGK